MTRVKFCGFTHQDDVAQAVALGADALGFVFYGPSSRYVSPEHAQTLTRSVPAFVTRVGLFVNEEAETVQRIFELARLNLIQYHGEESPEFCDAIGLPYIKAFRVRKGMDLRTEMDRYPNASGFLLDAYVKGQPGGTGERFDWELIPQSHAPIILAGGLTPDNAKDAIDQVAPWALDVSGGIETKPGRKDPDKMARFMNACRN
ncbi:MAG: phosphoribosylanthranilate isomerase [Gammaproteobacteria bacterium]|jgi:phosphoribosylanthranilate isomerase|nr:phosphoribosylanthranilate isomerase [Gammaproteobacteria bacterium]NCW74137.1 phosphoribosylanthranilate isomerase [Gammaproteobacteria bacterium]